MRQPIRSRLSTLGDTFALSLLAVGISVLAGQLLADRALQQALPTAVEQVLLAREERALADARQTLLADWNGAADSTADGRHVYGNPTAPFTLVEFSDLECPYCKRFHDTPKQLADHSNGQINWEWQHYPLAFHNPVAASAAHAAECVGEVAGNRAFWAFTGQWFARTQLNGQGVESVERLAHEVGAPRAAYAQCMASGKHRPVIEHQSQRGTRLGVTGTPATVVVDNTTGNTLLIKGAQGPKAFLEAMQQLVTRRDSAPHPERGPAPATPDGSPEAATAQ